MPLEALSNYYHVLSGLLLVATCVCVYGRGAGLIDLATKHASYTHHVLSYVFCMSHAAQLYGRWHSTL